MKYSAVVLDLDGTFLNSQKQVSKRNLQAVFACSELGMRVIFATARPPRSVKAFLPEKLFAIGSFVYYNGAQIICHATGLDLHEPIDSKLTAMIIDDCMENNLELAIEVKDDWYRIRESDFANTNTTAKPERRPIDELKQVHATKILIAGNSAIDTLRKKYGEYLHILLTDSGKLTQIMSKKASKELAVSLLCNKLGIPFEKVIAFGDDTNDLGLFQLCGYAVAMENAAEELKGIANEVTDSNDRDGVAKILEKLIAP